MAIFADDITEEESKERFDFVKPSLAATPIPKGENAWNTDPRIQRANEIYTYALSQNPDILDTGSWFDDNGNIKEVLRDEDYRIETMISRQGNIDNLTPEQKEAYKLLRTTWDEVEIENYGEALVDIGSDIIFNPSSLATLLFTGGVGNVATQTAGKEGLRQGLKRLAVSNETNPQAVRAAMFGAGYGAAHEDQLQRVEIGTGISDDYDINRTAIIAGFGALGGVALTKLLSGTGKYYKNRAKQRLESEDAYRQANQEGPSDGVDTEIFETVNDNVEIIVPSRSTEVSIDVKSGRTFTIIDQEPIEVFTETVNKKAGGGESTRQEMVDTVNQTIRDNPNMPLKNLKNRIGFEMGRITNKLGSKLVFKPASVVQSFSKYSQTATNLAKKFRYDMGRSVWGERDYDAQDFNEVYKETAGRYFIRAKTAMEPLALNMKGKLGDIANDNLLKALRGTAPNTEAISVISKELRSILDEIGDRLFEDGFIKDKVTNYVPRMWNRSAIEKNKDVFAQKLKDSGEVNSLEEGFRVVDNMLDKKNQLDGGGSGGNSFFFQRQFDQINDLDFEEYLNNDIVDVMNNYIFQSSKQLAKKQVFGVRNLKEYRAAYINPIREEIRKAGKTLTKSDELDLERVWKLSTGEDVSRFESSKVQGFIDTYSLANRLAYLPLATLSSVTEIFINVAKAGPVKSLKGFRDASDTAQETIQKTLSEKLGKEGLTQPEIWREMNKFGLALDTSMADLSERLSGEALSTEFARKVNNGFFRFNLLDQWTKSVQMMSYTTGKTLIRDNLTEISKNVGLPDSKRITRLKDELKELNVNIEDGLSWLEAGAKKEDPFEEVIQRGASRYANEVILNPSTESGLKPTLMANPQTSILFQFMGYPAAFTNTILKNSASNLLRSPTQNAPRILTASLIMTEMARWTNYARSGGESERFKDREEIYSDAVVRWGGNGMIADMMQRGQKAAQVYQDPLAYTTGVMGPVGQDLYTLIRRGDIVSFFGKKVPGYGAGKTVERTFDVDFMDAWNKELKEMDAKLQEAVVPERDRKPFKYNKGGEVLNVPNVPEEPDERIDKLTGQPYNKQAGTAFIDQEDALTRLGFKGGGSVDPLQRLGFAGGGKLLQKGFTNLADMAFEDVITTFSPRKISKETANKAAQKIENRVGSMGDFELEDFVKKSIRVQLEEKQDLSMAEIKQRFPQFISEEGYLEGSEEFSLARGYSPEAIKAFEEQGEAANLLAMEDIDGMDFPASIENDIAEVLEAINAKDKTDIEIKEEAFIDTKAEYERIDNIRKEGAEDINEAFPEMGTDLFAAQKELELLKEATDPTSIKTRQIFNELIKKMPRTQLPETPIKANPNRDANLKEALEESAVKVPVYRATGHGIDTDYEINFAFPRELGPHFGTKAQADDLATREHLNYEIGYAESVGVDPADLYKEDMQLPGSVPALTKGYLLLKNPLEISLDTGSFNPLQKNPLDFFEDMAKQLSKGDKRLEANLLDSIMQKYEKTVKPTVREYTDFTDNISDETGATVKLQKDIREAHINVLVKDFIKSYGFDSIKYRNKFEGATDVIDGEEDFSYIAFEPNQFKIITASDFNFEDDRVFKNTGGEILGELKTHIEKLSPEAKKTLTKTTSQMSSKQQQDFLASLQMGDEEFRTDVGRYMPEGSTIDPSVARLKAFPDEAYVGRRGLNLKGVSSKGVTDLEQLNKKYNGFELQLEPDTVSAVEAINANPRVFSHEYRHFEDADGSEMSNRVQDLMASQNEKELRTNVLSLASNARSYVKIDDKDARNLYMGLYNKAAVGTEKQILEAAQELLTSPMVTTHMYLYGDEGKGGFSKAVQGPYFKRNNIKVPENYKELFYQDRE